MNEAVRLQILEKIRQYDNIILTRHIRPDGDAVGSSRGLCALIRAAFPHKKVRVSCNDDSDLLRFLEPSRETLEKKDYLGALLIVLDSGDAKRVSNSHLSDAAEVIRIDHHINNAPYGDIAWVEDFRSSTSEMVALLSLESGGVLPMTEEAARCLYTGIVTDTGRFRFGPTTPETLRIAAKLLEFGIDTDRIFAELTMESYDAVRFKSAMLDGIRLTPNGVAYLYVTADMQRRYGLNREEASASVTFMENIRGSLVWLAFIDNMPSDDNYAGPSTRVRLRSRFLPINGLAEKYHGGGHEMASGATVYTEKEMKQLLADADALLAEYKRTHTDWL